MINISELLLNNATDEHYNVYPNLDAKYGPYESIEIALTNVPKSQRTQDNKIVAAENRLTSAENKIVAAENNISGLETSVQELQNTVGQPSIYTRGRVKKLHIKIGGIGNAVNFVPIVAGDYIGEFDVAVEDSDIIQRIPYSLHINSQSTEKPIESATIIGPSTALTNEVVTVNLICVPTDNTQMNDLTITPDSGCSVSDKSIAGNELTFLVTFSHSGSFDVVIDNPNTDDSWTYQVVVSDPPVSQDDNTACFVNYGLNDLNKVRYFDDTLYGGRININEMNYESTIERTPIYSKSGKVLTGWQRYCDAVDSLIAAASLVQAGEWRNGASQNGDLTSVFSVASEATCEYRYLYQYGGAQSDGWALKVPNGQYKIRILSCTSETNDKYINFNTFNINNDSVLNQLPLEKALTNNTEWVEFNPITVTNEVIWIYAAVAAKARCGINAIEIIKL